MSKHSNNTLERLCTRSCLRIRQLRGAERAPGMAIALLPMLAGVLSEQGRLFVRFQVVGWVAMGES